MKAWHKTAGAVAVSSALMLGSVGASYQVFIAPGGSAHIILWSPATGTRSAEEVGAVGLNVRPARYERGFGYPLTNGFYYSSEVRQKFSNGYTVNWSSATNRT